MDEAVELFPHEPSSKAERMMNNAIIFFKQSLLVHLLAMFIFIFQT